MFSLNVPVPGRVGRVAADFAPALAGFELVRDRHSLVVKRLGDVSFPDHVIDEARRALRGVEPFEIRIVGVDSFDNPPLGAGPVCYLEVESEGLLEVHRRLVDTFGAVDGLEGDDYTPHVSLARGGPQELLDGLVGRSIEPVSWTARELVLVDGPGGNRVGKVTLG